MTVPLFLKTKQTLKTLCYEYNGLAGLSLDILNDYPVLGITPSDDIYKIMLFSVCDNYWYDEIGFDIDEIFIERFNTTWERYSSQYHNAISAYLENNIYEITETRNVGQKDTGTTVSAKTGTDTNKNSGTVTNSGSRQDYQVQTQDTSNTQTNNLSNATTYNTEVENTQNLTKAINTTRTLKDLSPERLKEIIGSVGLLNAFVDCFHKLFMQIIVR